MGLYGNNRRGKGRARREFAVKIKTAAGQKQVYTVDVSTGGVRIGAPLLRLSLGETVEITIDHAGTSHTYSGQISRLDGMVRINRISRDVSAYFVRIVDEQFTEYIKKNFSV